MKSQYLKITGILIFFLVSGCANEPSFSTYKNERFDYQLEYPDYFSPGNEPSNQDGRAFHAEDAELQVFGINNIKNEPLKEIALSYLSDIQNNQDYENSGGANNSVLLKTEKPENTTFVKTITLGNNQVGVLILEFNNQSNIAPLANSILTSFKAIGPLEERKKEIKTLAVEFVRYENERMGISMLYPKEAKVDKPQENQVRIRKIGPGNEPASEITNGFTFTIFADPDGKEFSDIEEYADSILTAAKEKEEVEILSSLKQHTTNGIDFFSYNYKTALGTSAVKNIFGTRENKFYIITYSISGKDKKKYQETISKMIASIQFI